MSDKVHARVTHRFTASPERVYDAWLDPAKVRTWMKSALAAMGLPGDVRNVEIDARVGGRFLFSDMRDAGEAKHWGTYLELDRPHRIAFTWIVDPSGENDPSTVTVTIAPDGDGCIVTIVHSMDAQWAGHVKRTETGWSNMLRAIDALVDG